MTGQEMIVDLQTIIEDIREKISNMRTEISKINQKIDTKTAILVDENTRKLVEDAVIFMGNDVPAGAQYSELIKAVKLIQLNWYDIFDFERIKGKFPYIRSSFCLAKPRGALTCDVYLTVDNTDNFSPTDEQFAEIDKYAYPLTWEVDLRILRPTNVSVNITVYIVPNTEMGYTYAQARVAAETTIRNFVNWGKLGARIRLTDLTMALMTNPEIINCKFTSPTADSAGNATISHILGTLVIREMAE